MGSGIVLILDDDTDVVDLVRLVLTNEGYTVRSAHSAVDALALIEKEEPLLLIVDLMLPKMDGEEFLLELRRRNPSRSIPLILLSASSARERVAQRLAGGTSVAKPFSPAELVATVNRMLSAAPA